MSTAVMTEPVAKPKFHIGRWLWYRLIGRSSKASTIPRDSIREGLETVVFVVVLVFMLKQFVVEAFVIPTGSMAETLYGHRFEIHCPECGYDFQLNASCEVDPSDGRLRPVEGYCCPNCRYSAFSKRVVKDSAKDRAVRDRVSADFERVFSSNPSGDVRQPGDTEVPGPTSGDRVLVLKAIYHREKAVPGDVVVFKFPKDPQTHYSATNYIKRMWATGGQTLAIWRGDLYVCDTLVYTPEDSDSRGVPCVLPENSNEFWKSQYTWFNAEIARKRFDESRLAGFPAQGPGFKLIRKSDVLLAEMQRIVYDNDHQSAALKEKRIPKRWQAETADWASDSANQNFTHTGGGVGWLRYRNLISHLWHPPAAAEPFNGHASVVDNFLGYNSDFPLDRGSKDSHFWVGDLIVECTADVADSAAEVVLELSKGPNRFQAIFKGGSVTLRRTGPEGKDLATAAAPLKTGKNRLKFANVDCRLRVWVDDKAVAFDKPVDYAPLLPESFDPKDKKKEGWVTANDIDAPVSIGASGNVQVGKLMIYRDTYYIPVRDVPSDHGIWTYTGLDNVSGTYSTHYTQPGHYFCLGDNSAQSSDSRVWGTVPDRLLLGKAVCIFWPSWPVSTNRIGLIK